MTQSWALRIKPHCSHTVMRRQQNAKTDFTKEYQQRRAATNNYIDNILWTVGMFHCENHCYKKHKKIQQTYDIFRQFCF